LYVSVCWKKKKGAILLISFEAPIAEKLAFSL